MLRPAEMVTGAVDFFFSIGDSRVDTGGAVKEGLKVKTIKADMDESTELTPSLHRK